MEDSLSVHANRDGDLCVVSPVGEVDMHSMRPFREMVRRLTDDGVKYLVLDLREVNFLDSAGMSILFGAKKRLSEEKGECYVVTNQDGFVARTLKTIALETVLPHLHDLDAALEDAQRRREQGETARSEGAGMAREDRAVSEEERDAETFRP